MVEILEHGKIAVASVEEVGTNCWMPIRFLGMCYKCGRYDKCTYPEKVVNPEFEKEKRRVQRQRTKAIKDFENFKDKFGIVK